MGFRIGRLLTRGAVVALNSHWSEWREAEDLAHAAERTAFSDAMLFLEGRGPAPAQEQWERCKRLRRAADERFQLVVSDWNAIGRSPHPAPRAASFSTLGRASAA
jgi:hypothetical protein